MMSGQSVVLYRMRTMNPRYFGAVNPAPQIPPMLATRPKLRHFSAIQVWGSNQRFVDRDRRFRLNKRRTMRSFSAQAVLASKWTQDAPKAIDRIARIGGGWQCWASFSSWLVALRSAASTA